MDSPSCKMSDKTKFAIGAGFVFFFTAPIFRSGGRTDLTMFQWIVNHTIFGPPVEYVPEEDYAKELEGVICNNCVVMRHSELGERDGHTMQV